MIFESIDGGRLHDVDWASEIRKHQDGELVDVLHIQGVSEGRGNIRVAVSWELDALAAVGVHFAVAGGALLVLVEYFQCAWIRTIFTFFLVDLDLDIGICPEETANFVESSVLLLLVDLHEDVLQAFDNASI